MRNVLLVAVAMLVASPSVLADSNENSWENLAQLRSEQKIEVIDMKLKSFEGDFIDYSGDKISLRVGPQTVSISREDVLSVKNREKHHRLRNAVFGTLMGFAGGAAIGAIIAESVADSSETAYGASIGALVGMGAGAGVGAALPSPVTVYRARKRVPK